MYIPPPLSVRHTRPRFRIFDSGATGTTGGLGALGVSNSCFPKLEPLPDPSGGCLARMRTESILRNFWGGMKGRGRERLVSKVVGC